MIKKINMLLIFSLIIFLFYACLENKNILEESELDIDSKSISNDFEFYEPSNKATNEDIDSYVKNLINNLTKEEKAQIYKTENIQSEEDLFRYIKELSIFREYYWELQILDKEQLQFLKQEFDVNTYRDLFNSLKNEIIESEKEFNLDNFKNLIFAYIS